MSVRSVLTLLKTGQIDPLRKVNTVFLRKQPALEFNPHSNVIRNFWEKKKRNPHSNVIRKGFVNFDHSVPIAFVYFYLVSKQPSEMSETPKKRKLEEIIDLNDGFCQTPPSAKKPRKRYTVQYKL